MSFVIRTFLPEDLAEVMALWLAGNLTAHDFVPANYWQENFIFVQQALQQAEVYVATTQQQIVGFVGLQEDYLAGIFVADSFHGKGVGSALLQRVKERHDYFQLKVYQKNERAFQFYLQAGLTIAGEGIEEETQLPEFLLEWSKENCFYDKSENVFK